jgi:hypothetical protein
MGAPDTLDRAELHADGLRHHRACPVRCLAGRVFECQRDDPIGDRGVQRLDAGGARLVAKKAVAA